MAEARAASEAVASSAARQMGGGEPDISADGGGPVVAPERMIASGKYRRAVLVFGAQTGKSELMLDCAGQRLDQRPGPILYVGPNKQFLTEQFEPRVLALLDQSPTLTAKLARGKRMTKTRKMVGGVPFRLAHSGSSTALKSDPAVLALIDEYDEMVTNVNQQGGPLGLVERRGDTYADFVCVVTSTSKRGQVAAVEDQKSKLVFWDVAMSEDIESPIWQLWQQRTGTTGASRVRIARNISSRASI